MANRDPSSEDAGVQSGLLRRKITERGSGWPNHAHRHAASVLSRAARGSLSARTQPSQPSQSDSCPDSDFVFLRDIQ